MFFNADSRFLNGELRGDELYLSTFDGGQGSLWVGRRGADGRLVGKTFSLVTNSVSPWEARLDPAAKLTEYLTHRAQREAQVLDALRAVGPGGADTEALVAAIYTDVHEALWPVARFSVWAHLRKLADEGDATASDPDDPDATWLAA